MNRPKQLKRKLEIGINHYGEHGRITCELFSCVFVVAETRLLLFAVVAIIWLVLDTMILIQKITDHHEAAHHRAETRAMAAGHSFGQFPGEVE